MINLAHISDVARLAGVSSATVSRVINGTAKVSEEKVRRVLKAIEETNFKPNEIARSLYKKSSRIIGFIVPSILNIFMNEIGYAIEDEAFRNGYKMILCNSDENPEKEAEYINMLTSMNADGIIITANNENLEEEIHDCTLPIVVLDKSANNRYLATVQSDNYVGGKIAAEHLIECGCRNILLMKGPDKYLSSRRRFCGYSDACKKHNIEPLFIESLYEFQDGIECSNKILKHFPNVDGVIASSDMSAISLYKVFTEHGKHVPDDIMIVGYDGLQLSKIMTPEITTVVQPIEEIGRLAARLIINCDKYKMTECKEYVLPVSLKIRQTTKLK